MIIALVDNGSLVPAAHLHLRAVAAALSERTGARVHAVSWKHSDRLPAAALEGRPADTLAAWMRRQFAAGEREFVFVPFFISAQGAIGSALRADVENLRAELTGLDYAFTRGLAAPGQVGDLATIVVAQTRATIAERGLRRPNAIVVDHGGPSRESAMIRDEIAAAVRAQLASEIGELAAASMEGAPHAHNRPLLADQLAAPGFARGDVVVAPLFLSPGRHAGPRGDLAQIARRAARASGASQRCHFTGLVGTHPRTIELLAGALREALRPASAADENRALRATPRALPSPLGTNPIFQPTPSFA